MTSYSNIRVTAIIGVNLIHKYNIANVLRCITKLSTVDCGNTFKGSRVPHIHHRNEPFLQS